MPIIQLSRSYRSYSEKKWKAYIKQYRKAPALKSALVELGNAAALMGMSEQEVLWKCGGRRFYAFLFSCGGVYIYPKEVIECMAKKSVSLSKAELQREHSDVKRALGYDLSAESRRRFLEVGAKFNLNDANVAGGVLPLQDNSATFTGVTMHLVFRDLKEALITEIRKAEYVYGCMAWLTEFGVLNALVKKRGVMIAVQKEDFLRPDGGQSDGGKPIMRDLYSKMPSGLSPSDFPFLSKSGLRMEDGECSIRCVGNIYSSKMPVNPKMHNKFLVFADFDKKPYAAWSGSFNVSFNSSSSLENATIYRSKQVAKAFTKEFEQIYAISEPLDWESVFVAPGG